MSDPINSAGFCQMILCASAMIEQQKQQVNDLNVFPVPDGDTGTNMSLTIGAAATELRKGAPAGGVGKAAEITANAMLRGARGNSGVILSLLFRGFSRALKGKEVMNGADFAHAITEGIDAAYKAVMKPAEGTILTVSRVSSAVARKAADENPDIRHVLSATIESASEALLETVEQNPVLKKAGVIDAGAKGYIIILQGMLAALEGATEESLGMAVGAAADAESGVFSKFTDEDITFTYCTEFIVGRENDLETSPFAAFLESRGDSLVFVEDEEIIKVHVHTDHPGLALERAIKYGQLITVKIENMREQHTSIVSQEQAAPVRQIRKPEKKYGFVTVCAGEGLASVFSDLGADSTVKGGQTMNPSTEDILREIDQTPAEIVYVLPNNKNIIMAAQQCVPLCETKKVVVMPTNSVPEGVSAMLAVDLDADEEQNTAEMQKAIENVTTVQITYAARDSVFDGQCITQGDYMALMDGKLDCRGEIQDLLTMIAERLNTKSCEFLTVFYGEDVTEDQAAETESLLNGLCENMEITVIPGGQPVYYYIISAE